MLRIITNLVPKKIRDHLLKLVVYSRLKIKVEKSLGIFILASLGFALLLSLAISLLSSANFFLVFVIAWLIIVLGAYFIISLKADSVATSIENSLPDALQLMTSNLRAGLTTDKALLLSARPEFGVLSEELNHVGRKLALGGDVGESLMIMSEKVKSEKFKKTINLLVSGLRSGGELADLLDQIVSNLRRERFVDEKIRTNVLMYSIFIFIAIGVGAPMLFGLSSFLISVIQDNLQGIDIPKNSSLPITFSQVNIESSFVVFFSIISLLTVSILGSLVVGLISKGSEKKGVKLIPILIILSLGVFFLARFLIKTLLGGLFGI